ncbi:MAG: hypothetical protein ACO3JG_12695 [Luteolibacter sp.]
MKARLFILAASFVPLANAQPFPATPGLDGLVATAIRERKAKAPHFAEGQSLAVVPNNIDRIPAVPSIGPTDVPAVKPLPAHPVSLPPKPAKPRTLARIELDVPDDLGALPPPKLLLGIKPMSIDPFTLKLEFIWEKPHGQWMSQLLKDIEAARKAGDTETYSALTARYTAWAEKYLRRREPPDLDNLR